MFPAFVCGACLVLFCTARRKQRGRGATRTRLGKWGGKQGGVLGGQRANPRFLLYEFGFWVFCAGCPRRFGITNPEQKGIPVSPGPRQPGSLVLSNKSTPFPSRRISSSPPPLSSARAWSQPLCSSRCTPHAHFAHLHITMMLANAKTCAPRSAVRAMPKLSPGTSFVLTTRWLRLLEYQQWEGR